MKRLLIIMVVLAFTSVNTYAENIKDGKHITSSIKKSSAKEDWNAIKQAILNNDAKALAAFAGNDGVDSEALIKDASALSYVHQVLKSYDYKHLITKTRRGKGSDFLVFEAHTAITSDDNVITAHVFELYMTEKDGKLRIDFYVNVKA